MLSFFSSPLLEAYTGHLSYTLLCYQQLNNGCWIKDTKGEVKINSPQQTTLPPTAPSKDEMGLITTQNYCIWLLRWWHMFISPIGSGGANKHSTWIPRVEVNTGLGGANHPSITTSPATAPAQPINMAPRIKKWHYPIKEHHPSYQQQNTVILHHQYFT